MKIHIFILECTSLWRYSPFPTLLCNLWHRFLRSRSVRLDRGGANIQNCCNDVRTALSAAIYRCTAGVISGWIGCAILAFPEHYTALSTVANARRPLKCQKIDRYPSLEYFSELLSVFDCQRFGQKIWCAYLHRLAKMHYASCLLPSSRTLRSNR